jgi:hypothetical protein
MIRFFTAAPLFLIAVAPAGAQDPHHYGPPINPQQVIMEQRFQDAISRNAATRLLDQQSPRPMVDPGIRYGSGTVIVVPDVGTRRLKASKGKRQVSARGKRTSIRRSAIKASPSL